MLIQKTGWIVLGLCLSVSWISTAQDAPPIHTPVPAAPTPEAIKKLIEKLEAPDNIVREDAEKSLILLGSAALPLLKEALKSPSLEIAARAKRLVGKLSEVESKPLKSYAEILPEGSIFLLETPNVVQMFEHYKLSPLGKLWELPAMKKFYKGHRDDVSPDDQLRLDTLGEIRKLLEGRALMHIGLPSSAEQAELNPPVIFLFESKQAQTLEAKSRALFESIQDPCTNTRHYGPFSVEEQINGQTVFGQESVVHALTQKAIDTYLDLRLQKPAKTLDTLLTDIRALMPNADIIAHIARRESQSLSDNAQLIDDDMIKGLNTYGFFENSTIQTAITINENGFEEYVRVKLVPEEQAAFAKPDAETKADPKIAQQTALLPLLQRMANEMPKAPAAAEATPSAAVALNLVPWQSGVVISFNADISNNAILLGHAMREIDLLHVPPAPKNPHIAPIIPETVPVIPVAPPAPPAAEAGAADPTKPNPTPKGTDKKSELPAPAKVPSNTLGNQALEAGGGSSPKPSPAPAGDPKPVVTPAIVYPMISRFEKMGIKLEQFLLQINGPVHLAIFFPQKIGEDAPETVPVSPLFCAVLKDPKLIAKILDAGLEGLAPRFRREALNGGAHYIDIVGNNQTGSGFWLKDNYLAYSTDRDLLDLAGLALAHEKNNERIADRAAYKQGVAAKKISADSLLTIFGEADQMLEMSYRMSKINWEENTDNPWPDWAVVKPLLANKPVLITVKGTPEGLQAWAQTPLTVFGMALAFRWPLLEANLIK